MGSNTPVLGFRLYWCSSALRFSDFFRSIEIRRSQGASSTSTPTPSSYPSKPLWLCLYYFARKNFYACCFVQGVV
ncbi:hypothetical protein A2U01_0054317, partial [Trifolium medium]|nr:hypothetical protein [Trifolium medium]